MAITVCQAMDPQAESRLLRRAIEKGLLCWEDLEALERAPAGEGSAPASEGWLSLLVASGRLDARSVAELAAELASEQTDATLDLTRSVGPGGDPSPSWHASRSDAGPEPRAEEERPSFRPSSGPELRFLAGWERYRVERFLGAGGMGAVYQAFDPALKRAVALKFLHRNEPVQIARFQREARAQARVDHPNVCRIYEVGEFEGLSYIAMQHIDGRGLAEIAGELPLEARVGLVRQVAWAVHAAHRTGLVHRDLKPGNILVGRGETGELHPYVVDFGLAQDQSEQALTRTGLISGTPAYVSPEQAEGKPLDRRTDVYSLGVVLYELIVGRPPFAGASPAATLVRTIEEEPEPPRRVKAEVPRDLETIVLKCLEKDPGRRYDSARALAEDLGRYLEGEPVAARPAGPGDRAAKWVRRNRALAAVATAAVLALLALGGFSLRSAWQARERAALAQEFGQRVKDLEAKIRFVAFLPRHDITPHKEEIRREIAELRREMARLGPFAEGPGHYALGRMHLALHQYETARDHLERAWAAGQQGPEVAAALGRAVGLLYEKALAGAQADPSLSRDASATAREEIEHAYRRPALAYLREGSGDDPYRAALIAFYERRYEAAVAQARAAHRRTPWFYEAAQLEAEASVAQALDAAGEGRYEEAFQLYDRAGEVYRRLLAEVPSDAALYAAECRRRARRIELASRVGALAEEQVAAAVAVCDQGIEVDPGLGEALSAKASLLRLRGEQRAERGEDPRADLGTARRLAGRAIALNPRDAQAYHELTATLRTLALWEQGRGIDPTATLERAVRASRRAVAVQPELARNHTNLGITYLLLSTVRQRRGTDPRPLAERARSSLERAVAFNPRDIRAQINLGNCWKVVAEAEITQGLDPRASVARALAALERAALLNPKLPAVFNNLGSVHLTLGEYLLTRGEDPRQPLARAAASYRRALALKPDYSLSRYNLGYTWRSLGEALLARGEDPRPALAQADRSLGEVLRRNPADADSFLERARVDLIAARWQIAQGRDPRPALLEADEALGRAAALNSQEPEIYFCQALVRRYRAEHEIARGGRPLGLVREGLDLVATALDLKPGEASFLAIEGVLHRLAARLERTGERQAMADRAVRSLEQAVAANPLLQREYGPALAEAREEAAADPPPQRRQISS